MNFIESVLFRFGYIKKPAVAIKRKRICRVCGKQIARNDKWHCVQGNPQHWYCFATKQKPDDSTLSHGEQINLPLQEE